MASLLDEAFIEANALKKAARSQAQTDIIEKYADEIKSNMSQLLEQKEIDLGFGLDEQDDEDEFGSDEDAGLGDDLGGDPMGAGMGDLGGDMGGTDDGFDFEDDLELTGGAADSSYLDKQVPYGFSEGEKLCDCPDDDEEIEINFDDLMGGMDDEDPMDSPSTFGRNDAMGDIMGGGEDEDEEFLEEFELDDDLLEEFLSEYDEDEEWTTGPNQEDFEDDLPRGELPAFNDAWERGDFVQDEEPSQQRTRDERARSGRHLDGSRMKKEVVGRGGSREDINDVGGVEFEEDEFDDEFNEPPKSNTFYQYANELEENLVADVEEQPSGWSPRSDADFDDEFDKLLSRLENPGNKDEDLNRSHSAPGDRRTKNDVNDRLKENFNHVYNNNKQLKSNLIEFRNKSKNLIKENRNLKNKANNYREKLLETADLLQSLNVENIKLGLQKKVFENISLNERQKKALVEAISDAKTADEARNIFKLQGTVGSKKKATIGQNPLTEALKKKPSASSVLQNSRRAKENDEQEMLDESTKQRWKKIAKLI